MQGDEKDQLLSMQMLAPFTPGLSEPVHALESQEEHKFTKAELRLISRYQEDFECFKKK